MSEIDHKNALPAGFQLQEYVIESLLGHGGFGLTYLARDTHLDKLVAIKEYMPQDLSVREGKTSLIVDPRDHSEDWHNQQERFAADARTVAMPVSGATSVVAKSGRDADCFKSGLERFSREARTLARFKHPNIVRVLRFIEANNTAYLVMEYEEGHSLGEYIRRQGSGLDEDFLLKIFIPILDGLEAVHEIGLLHRDIKPDNIYLRSDASAMLIDFGSARYGPTSADRSASVMVTAGFAPFEQYSSTIRQGPWTDVYGIGASLYFCMTGNTVPSAVDRSSARLEEEPDLYRPVRELARRDYSDKLLDAVDAALAFRIGDRPQSAAQLRKMLGEAPAGLSASAMRKRRLLSAPGPVVSVSARGVRSLRDHPRLLVSVALVTVVALTAMLPAPDKGTGAASVSGFEQILSPLAAECETLAGSVYQPDSGGAGVALEDIDTARAIPVCIEALNEHTTNPKLQFMLGRAFHARGDYSQALKYIRRSANTDYAPAEGSLGWMYEHGKGVDRNLRKARQWYTKAAEHGNAYGQSVLGWMYAKGVGVARNSARAVEWFRKSSEQGLADAQNNLGVMYRNGDGVGQDPEQAVEWFRLAANQGLAVAQNNLGDMYRHGEGVERDAEQAFSWYLKAAEQGFSDAKFKLSAMYANGEGVRKSRKKARFWHKEALR